MKLLEYLYFRMYSAYSKKNDSPVFRAFMYISLFIFLKLGILLIYLEKVLTKLKIISEYRVDVFKHSCIFWLILISSIFIFIFFKLTKKPYYYYQDKFSNSPFNKYIKIWMLLLIPFLIFYFSIDLYIYLFGGHSFGKEIIGIFE